MKQKLAIAGLIVVTVIWGGGFTASDMALETLLPFQIMTIRFFLAAALMGGMSIKKLNGIEKGELKAGVLMGGALFMGFAFQIIGLQYTTVSKNAFLTATNVVLVPFIVYVIYRKRVKSGEIIGAVLAIIGVGVLSLENNLTLGLGDGLTLICAVGFAFQIFLTGEFVQKHRAAVLNFIQMCTAFVLSAGCLVLFGQLDFAVSGRSMWSVVYLGVVSTAVTYLLQTTCQRYVDETKAAVILSLESVFGTLFSVWLLGEHINVRMMVGCIIILTAVIISNVSDKEQLNEV